MARPTYELITALRATADRLEGGVRFQWAHMGSCNCGHLAQTVTSFSKEEIHSMALENRGDWATQALDYCPQSGYPLDHIIEKMVEIGLDIHDIASLERLSDATILREIAADAKPLDHRNREDAILYLRSWADLLEKQWRQNVGERQKRDRQEREKV